MPEAYARGRLDELLASRDGAGWAAFWRARAQMALDEFDAMPAFELAYRALLDEGDHAGCGLVARTAVLALYYGEATYVGLASWLARSDWGVLPPIELHDASARAWWLAGELARVYAHAGTEYASAATLAVRDMLMQLVSADTAALDADAFLMAVSTLLEYADFEDDGRLFDQLFASAAPLLDADMGTPLYRGRAWHRIRCAAYSIGPHRGRGLQRIDTDQAEARAFSVAERHGLRQLRAHLLVTRCFFANVSRDEAAADRALAELGQVTDFRRPLPAAWYYYLRGQAAARREEATEALLYFGQAVSAAEAGETPINVQQNYLISHATALAHAGQWDAATRCFDRLIAELSGRDGEIVAVRRALVGFYRARVESPDEAPLLRAAILAQARALRWVSFGLLTPRSTGRFLADALRDGVAPEFVKQIVRQRQLSAEPAFPRSWPWAVRIGALGHFRIEVDDAPVAFGARPQRRPLELLMLLVALGPQPAPVTTVMDTLWSDADGDKAKSSLDMAVLRLRRLLGHEDALRIEGAHLFLDRRQVWVDAWAFPEDASVEYTGSFLAGEKGSGAVEVMRERLEQLFVQRVLGRGEALEADGGPAEALALYESALRHDGLAEALHRGVIRCHLALGEPGSAVRAFRRCRD
ncbi:MAG: hypothetical protein H7Y61_20545, partial [Rhizobiales bacterium]|nr:hypothetical protein [Rhizobacter sp.]